MVWQVEMFLWHLGGFTEVSLIPGLHFKSFKTQNSMKTQFLKEGLLLNETRGNWHQVQWISKNILTLPQMWLTATKNSNNKL